MSLKRANLLTDAPGASEIPPRPRRWTGLNAIATELNDRPRMTLGYRTPAEKMTELLR